MYKILLFILFSLHAVAGPGLSRVLVNNQPYDLKKSPVIHLEPSNEQLLFEFEPAKGDTVFYHYRLEGLQSRWFKTSYPVVNFQHLAGGEYTFRFKSESDGLMSSETSVRIIAKQAFWQKWWFWPLIAIYVILILGIGIYLFFMYDIRQKLRLHHVRNQIASDLHDEVGSNLNSIAIFVELLRKKVMAENPELLPILDKITSNSEETVTLMKDTVWAINPLNDSTEKLIDRMHSFGAEILSARGIAFEFESEKDLKKDIFSMEQRRNLYLVYKEAINNIAKHSSASRAKCLITYSENEVKVAISDNGKGFDFKQSFEGNGLKNFKIRSQEEDLKVDVESSPGDGTQLNITLFV